MALTHIYRVLAWVACAFVATHESAAQAPTPQRLEWRVDGVAREALVYAPATATTTPAPLVFAFHGHGGSAEQFARSAKMHLAWPEALVVYPQGLKTPGMTDPEGKKSGWQNRAGAQDDRDLKFFDAMLAGLHEKFKIDDHRVYSTGHSNGGGFTYLLWEQRGEVFAAIGPSSAGTIRVREETKPRPLIHIAGATDAIVPIAFQQRTLSGVRFVNGCDPTGSPWAEHCTVYSSKGGAPVVVCVHPGGHEYFNQATALIVRFFKEHSKVLESTPAVTPASPTP